MPNEVKVPKFSYPFKRNTKNSANKEKSTQEFYEEILFKDYHGQYLFNRSGLFHGGVHLYEDRFPFNDFHTNGIRAIADGKLIYYRIDKEFLENELDNGTKLKYSSSFMLLEHEMAYPAANKLKFYTLYMHMAPVSEYEFVEHALEGDAVYVRDINGADMSISKGTKVTLGKSLKDKTVGTALRDKKNRYEVLSYGSIKPPTNDGWNVHITNIEKVVETTVKGTATNIANMRKGCSTKAIDIVGSPLTVGETIKINAVQTLKEKEKGRYAVISVNAVAVTSTNPRATIHKSNLTDSIVEPIIGNVEENGLVTKHMASLAGAAILPTSQGIEVKAGEVLGKLGCYNTREWEDEMELVAHVEAFTFHDDLEKFIEDATTEYEKSGTLTAQEKKVRPKENQLIVKSDVKRFTKNEGTYAKIAPPPNDTCTLKTGSESKVIANGAIVKINSTEINRRHNILSIEEGDVAMKSKLEEDLSKTWTVHSASVKVKHAKFTEILETRTDIYVKVIKALKKLKEIKDKEETTYILLENQQGIDIYVKESDIEKTHGITFKAFTYMEGEGEKKVGIFEEISKYYSKREDEIPQQDKEKLNELFGKVLKHIKLDKDESEVKKNTLEAGEFAALSKSNKERRRAMSHILIKHESEWEVAREENFDPIIEYMEEDQLTDRKKMFEDRLEKLAFSPKLLVGEGKTPTFIHPIALVEGFVGGGLITRNMLNAICPGSGNNQGLIDALSKYCPQYEINTALRIAHFLSQCAQEGSCYGKSTYVEGTNFGLSNALRVWPSRASSIRQISMNGVYLKQPDLFKSVYGTRNGNISGSNDGYDFRGRGLIQITGRTNYRSFTTYHNSNNSDDIKDFENNATHRELTSTNIEYAVESACWFWRYNGNKSTYRNTNALADMGTSEDIVHAIGANVNGWYATSMERNGYVWNNTLSIWLKHAVHHAERLAKFNILKNHLGL